MDTDFQIVGIRNTEDRTVGRHTKWYQGKPLISALLLAEIFAHYQKLSFSFYDDQKVGQLMSRVTADLFDITDEKWKDAIEGRLGKMKYSLVTPPEYALEAAKIFRKMTGKEFEEFNLINTAAIKKHEPKAKEHTLYEAVETKG